MTTSTPYRMDDCIHGLDERQRAALSRCPICLERRLLEAEAEAGKLIDEREYLTREVAMQKQLVIAAERGPSGEEAMGIQQILNEPFIAGSRVTNCVSHMSKPLTERPRDCDLCRTDLENQLRFAIRVNEFLNSKIERARAKFNLSTVGGEGMVMISREPTEQELWQIMIAGEMDTTAPQKSGLARARAARDAVLSAASTMKEKPKESAK